ncbi:MAG: cytochrome c [Candidatus Korobacteraceae bacterium]
MFAPLWERASASEVTPSPNLTSAAKAERLIRILYVRLKACSTRGAAALLAAAALALLAGCREDMQNQPYYRPLTENTFYADKRSARPIVSGTVARGHLDADTYFYTGKIGQNDGEYMPFSVTAEVMARGQQRFNIYCSPCHSMVGDGNGMIVQRGFKHPPSYHIDRLRRAPIGYFFDVMTNGFGAMPDYSEQVAPADRWAIAAYIRALQLSQHATEADVPAGEQIAPTPPPGINIMPPYDTQTANTAASTPPAAQAAPAAGGAQKP